MQKNEEENNFDLVNASKNNDLNLAKKLIKNGADVNVIGEDGDTALIHAVMNSDLSLVRLLIENGADVNVFGYDDQHPTALIMTSDDNDIAIAKLLIENGANIDACDMQGFTSLVDSAHNDNIDIAKFLLENGANVNISVMGGWTALMFACNHNQNYNMAKLFIENGADINAVDESGNTVLMMACEKWNENIVKLLVENGADVNSLDMSGYTPLMLSCSKNNIKMSKLLIKYGADVHAIDNYGFSALMYAAINKSKIFEFINADENLSLAAKNDLIERLISGEYSKYNGSKTTQIEIVQILIDNGININHKANNGLTAYDIAYATRNNKVKNVLRKNNAKTNTNLLEIKAKIYKFLIDKEVISLDDFDTCVLEIENPLDTKDTKDLEENVFFTSINVSLIDLKKETFPMEFFIRAIKDGVDINYQDNNGITALMLAAKTNDKDLVELLLKNGASLDIQNKDEEDVYDYAYNEGHEEIVNILDRYKELRKANHTPEQLVKTLTNFTSPDSKPIRYTTHSWDFGGLEKEYGSFENFMKEVKLQWDDVKDELKELSPNLHEKVDNFLWETDDTKALGWSSIKGLDKWCNDGNLPHEYKVGDKTFGEIITDFKHEIEIRKENDRLEDIFIRERKRLRKQFPKKFKIEHIKLKGKTFYTDVEKFKNGLAGIYDGIIQFARKDDDILYPNIEVKAIEDDDSRYVELHITHIDSFTSSNAKNMLKEIEDGGFSGIKSNLNNLCDWSIQNSYDDKNYQVNYLRSVNTQEIIELNEKPIGFTHILRFYK